VNGPNRYFRQHYAVDAPQIDAQWFQPAYRVRPRLEQLEIDRAITPRELLAGRMFRAWAEIVIAGMYPARWFGADQRIVKRSSLDRISYRIDASNRLHEIHVALGAWTFGLLELHIVKDLDWTPLGKQLNVHRKTARTWTIDALRQLAGEIWK
jgi:hypothetical protein